MQKLVDSVAGLQEITAIAIHLDVTLVTEWVIFPVLVRKSTMVTDVKVIIFNKRLKVTSDLKKKKLILENKYYFDMYSNIFYNK